MVANLLAGDGVVDGCYRGRWREEEELRLWAAFHGRSAASELGCLREREGRSTVRE